MWVLKVIYVHFSKKVTYLRCLLLIRCRIIIISVVTIRLFFIFNSEARFAVTSEMSFKSAVVMWQVCSYLWISPLEFEEKRIKRLRLIKL